MNNLNTILALSPHADDVELSAGGTLAKWIEEGKEVFYIAFSIAEKSVAKGLPKNILENECKQATTALGISGEHVSIHKFAARNFPELRQEILELLIEVRDKLQPDLVLLPSLEDIHQDHQTIAKEGIRAFKHTNILGYELPWNLFHFEPSLFTVLQRRNLDRKVEAISCYQSQIHRNYISQELVYGLARIRGSQINVQYAEAFEVIRWIIR